ncbi:MAG: MCP four helix bundle domain-containing protein [Lachnospiraceae bacterium]|nr:MCP four helix bundle domain-containing protein [Lachnospiraceae bacterium]
MKKKFKEMKIKKRLVSAFTIVISIFVLVAVVVAGSMMFMVKNYDKVLTYYAFPQGDIGMAMNATAEIRSATRAIIGYETRELIDAVKGQRDQFISDFNYYIEKVRPTMITPEGDACMAAIDEAWEKYYTLENEIVALGDSTDPDQCALAQERMISELTPLYRELDEAMKNLMEVNVQKGAESQGILRTLEWISLGLILVSIIGVVIISMRIASIIAIGIEKPLQDLEERLEEFAHGELSAPFPKVDSKDEIAHMVETAGEMAERLYSILSDTAGMMEQMAAGNFRIRSKVEEQYQGEFKGLLDGVMGMNQQMSLALGEVEIASLQVYEGANHLANASQDLAEGATEQAATVEEMQATINTLNEGIHSTSNQLDEAYHQAQRYAQVAENSRADMENLMAAMEKISDASEKIGNIIGEIEDIASQTNLLSLNASIEAARAGDAGRGFAVVADQIRTLAEQSAKSAVDSRQLIEASLAEVANGNKVAVNASESLQEVVAGVHSLAESAKEMKEISAGQALTMEQADSMRDLVSRFELEK